MMNKYIDIDKLIAEIKRFRASEYGGNTLGDDVANGALDYVLEEIIPSLQQEQPKENEVIEKNRIDAALIGFHLACGNGDKTIGECIEFWKPIIIDSIKQEQPKFNVGDLVVSKKNPHLTYRILATNIPNELGKTDYKVEIFTDGKPGLLDKPHNIHLISSDKIEDWGELVQQEQPEYGYLSTEYIHGKKPRWNVGDVLAYYICTSNEEGECIIGKVSNVEFDDEDGWLYTIEDEYVDDEQSLVEEGVYKKNR